MSDISSIARGGHKQAPAEVHIYRLELIFLHPEENRWQMFQCTPHSAEGEGGGRAVYQNGALGILRWVREAVRGHCASTYKRAEVTDFGNNTDLVTLDLIPLHKVLLNACQHIDPRVTYDNFIKLARKRMSVIMKYNNISLDHYEILFGLLEAPSQASQDMKIKLSRPQALKLASALFYANHWDLFGMLSFPRANITPPSPATIRYFAYQLKYIAENADRSPKQAERMLGYRVNIKLSGDISEFSSKESDGFTEKFVEKEIGYFDLCEDIVEFDSIWYCLYGYLLDAIHKAVADQPMEYPLAGKVDVTCIPIRVCGYDHFLQLYARPNPRSLSKETNALSITEMLSQFYNNTRVELIAFIKDNIRELLVQTHISAFQNHVMLDVMGRRERLRHKDADDIFCQHAPNLVRMKWIKTELGARFSYSSENGDIFKTWRRLRDDAVLDGDGDEHIASVRSKYNGHIKAMIPWEKELHGALAPLFRGTGEQTLQAQYEWVVRKVDAQITMKKLKVRQKHSQSATAERKGSQMGSFGSRGGLRGQHQVNNAAGTDSVTAEISAELAPTHNEIGTAPSFVDLRADKVRPAASQGELPIIGKDTQSNLNGIRGDET